MALFSRGDSLSLCTKAGFEPSYCDLSLLTVHLLSQQISGAQQEAGSNPKLTRNTGFSISTVNQEVSGTFRKPRQSHELDQGRHCIAS